MAKKEFAFTAEEMRDLLGNESAEEDNIDRLRGFFFQSQSFTEFNDDSRLCILIAHKGVGKSALLRVSHAHQRTNNRAVIDVQPKDVVDIPISQEAPFVKKLEEWKTGLRRVISQKVCSDLLGVVEPKLLKAVAVATESSTHTLGASLRPDYLEVNDVPRSIGEKLQMAICNSPLYVFIDDLDLGWHHGSGTERDIQRIATLFQALREMAHEANLRFRVAIRSDVFYLVSTSYNDVMKVRPFCRWHRWSNHDLLAILAKKILSYRAMRLGDHSAEVQKNEQHLSSEPNGKLSTYFGFLFESPFGGSSAWRFDQTYKVLLTVIRKRPRDLVALLGLAAQRMRSRVAGHNAIRPQLNRLLHVDFRDSFLDYSQLLLHDTINEYRGELPDIHILLKSLGPTLQDSSRPGRGFVMTSKELRDKLAGIIGSNVFGNDRRYFTSSTVPTSSQKDVNANPNADVRSPLEARRELTPANLLEFLFRINFIVLHEPGRGGTVKREYFDESRFDIAGLTVPDDALWEIHPAFRWALNPDPKLTFDEIVKDIPLIPDDPAK